MGDVTVNLTSEFANDPDASVEDGETFLTVAKDKSTGIYQLYQPDRENFEFVGLSEDHIESLNSNRVEEDGRFKVWGEKERWDDTPSPIYNI